ncbi:peptide deformylase [Spartinivicinus ruber]|uniref:peptide deformylase n=1 Tax=Spartinivicinus ruber TaxID=2683272 RepID=UPI0013D0CFB4|nr:peptide deformylase [Spartinivicinus ruber]
MCTTNRVVQIAAIIATVSITACSNLNTVTTEDAVNINNFTYTGGVLREKSSTALIGSEETKTVANRLLTEVKKGDHAVGLAAPQIGIGKRIFVFQVPKGIPEKLKDKNIESLPWTVAINPKYVPTGNEVQEMVEGCFSVPHFYGTQVPRYKKIRYSYSTIEGDEVEGIATGLFAQIFQHETDHLDGKLYIDLVKNKNSLKLLKDLPKKPVKSSDDKKS